jgi:hypothetical protein
VYINLALIARTLSCCLWRVVFFHSSSVFGVCSCTSRGRGFVIVVILLSNCVSASFILLEKTKANLNVFIIVYGLSN